MLRRLRSSGLPKTKFDPSSIAVATDVFPFTTVKITDFRLARLATYASNDFRAVLHSVTVDNESVKVASADKFESGNSIFGNMQVDPGKHLCRGSLQVGIATH